MHSPIAEGASPAPGAAADPATLRRRLGDVVAEALAEAGRAGASAAEAAVGTGTGFSVTMRLGEVENQEPVRGGHQSRYDPSRRLWREAFLLMSETIRDLKYVTLNYGVVDLDAGHLLRTVEGPLAYMHGASEVLSEQVQAQLQGTKSRRYYRHSD